MAEAREFTDSSGQRWRAFYAEANVGGMIAMNQVVFQPLDRSAPGGERYLTAHPGYLESADDHQLEIALSQAQDVEPPL